MRSTMKNAAIQRAFEGGSKFRDDGTRLLVEGTRLLIEGDRLRDEGDKLRAKGHKLCDAGYKLRDEGDRVLSTAVKRLGKNVTIGWNGDGSCTIASVTYGPSEGETR